MKYAGYHPKWRLISRLVRFRRAKGICEWCGAVHMKPHPITKSRVVLATAHIDRNTDNNKFDNLAALCQRCHLRHDLGQHIFSRKYGRNSLKFQLSLFNEQRHGYILS